MKVRRALLATWLVLAHATLLGCQNITIGRDSSDAAGDRTAGASNGAETSSNLDGPSNLRDLGKPGTSSPDAGGVGVGNCESDLDCTAYIDYCRGVCGACTPTTIVLPTRSACLVPSDVSCRSACEGRMAVCAQGTCAVR